MSKGAFVVPGAVAPAVGAVRTDVAVSGILVLEFAS